MNTIIQGDLQIYISVPLTYSFILWTLTLFRVREEGEQKGFLQVLRQNFLDA